MPTKTTYPLKPDAFTTPGFNDRPKPCKEKGCIGMVHPTRNANVGRCDLCGKEVSWGDYLPKAEK